MDAYNVSLSAIGKESSHATIDLGRSRDFIAWGSVTMVDSLHTFDRDNAYALDIFEVDGERTASRAYGGDHWGPRGSGDNVYEGALVGHGRRITFWLRAMHYQDLTVLGVGIVLAL